MKNSTLEVMETTRPIIGPDVEEGLIEFGQDFYCIPDVGRIPPFLMSIISDGDRWMFFPAAAVLLQVVRLLSTLYSLTKRMTDYTRPEEKLGRSLQCE